MHSQTVDAMIAAPAEDQQFQPLATATAAILMLATSNFYHSTTEYDFNQLMNNLPNLRTQAQAYLNIPHNTNIILRAAHVPINDKIGTMCHQLHYSFSGYSDVEIAAIVILVHAKINFHTAWLAIQTAIHEQDNIFLAPALADTVIQNITITIDLILTTALQVNQRQGQQVAPMIVNKKQTAIATVADILVQAGVRQPDIPEPVARADQQVDRLIERSYFSPEMQYDVIQCAAKEENRQFKINVVTGKPSHIPTIDNIIEFQANDDAAKKIKMNALFSAYEAVNIACFLAGLEQAYASPDYILHAPGLSSQLTQGAASLVGKIDIFMPPVDQDILTELQNKKNRITQTLSELRQNLNISSWVASYLPTTVVSMFSPQTTPPPNATRQIFTRPANSNDPKNIVTLAPALIQNIVKNFDYKSIKQSIDTANLLFQQCFLAQRTVPSFGIGSIITCIPRSNTITPTNYIFNAQFSAASKHYTLTVDNLCNFITSQVNDHDPTTPTQAHELFKEMRKAVQTAIYIANKNSNLYTGYIIPPAINRYFDSVVGQLMHYDTKLSQLCKNENYGGRYDDYYRDMVWSTITLIAAGLTAATIIDTIAGPGTSSNAIQHGAQQIGYYGVEGLKKLAYYGLISPLVLLGNGISYTGSAIGGAASGSWNSILGKKSPAEIEQQKRLAENQAKEEKINSDPILKAFWKNHPGQTVTDLTAEDKTEYDRLRYMAETNLSEKISLNINRARSIQRLLPDYEIISKKLLGIVPSNNKPNEPQSPGTPDEPQSPGTNVSLLNQFFAFVGDTPTKTTDRASEIIYATNFKPSPENILENPGTPDAVGGFAAGAASVKIKNALTYVPPKPTAPNMFITKAPPGKEAQFILKPSPKNVRAVVAPNKGKIPLLPTSGTSSKTGSMVSNLNKLIPKGPTVAVGVGAMQAGHQLYLRATDGKDGNYQLEDINTKAIEQATDQAIENSGSYG
jgi:hypothetical protein